MSVPNNWIVITGGAGALGQTLVQSFAGAGRNVLVLDRRAGQHVPGATFRECDCLDTGSIAQALRETIGAEKISLLINLAGQIHNQPLLQIEKGKLRPHDLETFRSVVDSNLSAVFTASGAVAAHMARTGGGAIVNLSSIAAKGNRGQPAYSAAKAGVEGLTRTLAQELGPLGIRVNALALGFFDVPSTRAAMPPDLLEAYVKRTPLGRLGASADLLNAIIFLESNAFLTGAVIDLDGGLRL